MKNNKITRKITQGMYILTTKNGGCVVDAVSQISSGDNPLISVSVMKTNNTNLLLKEHKKFALSVIGKDVDGSIISTFGMNSSRDIDKFENVSVTEVEGINIIDNTLGYIVCDVVDMIENDTHTLFIGRMIEGDIFDNEESPMSYSYYQENKNDLLKVTTTSGKTAWVCTVCGYVYYGDELPEDFKCPVCGVGKELFTKK